MPPGVRDTRPPFEARSRSPLLGFAFGANQFRIEGKEERRKK
jgi:hypothetical protein